MFTRLLPAMALLAIAPTLHAQDARWYRLGTTDGMAVDIDTLTMARTDHGYTSVVTGTVWVRYTYDKPQKSQSSGKLYVKIIAHDSYDCSARTWSQDGENTYTADGTLASSLPAGMVTPPQVVAPETVGEIVLTAVCAKLKTLPPNK